MKVIIAGSRDITNATLIQEAVDESGFEVTEVLCGMARGVDLLGKEWAESKGIPVLKFPADWTRYGKEAGKRRNLEMAMEAEAVIVVWDGSSPGSAHMAKAARFHGLPCYVKNLKHRKLKKPL